MSEREDCALKIALVRSSSLRERRHVAGVYVVLAAVWPETGAPPVPEAIALLATAHDFHADWVIENPGVPNGQTVRWMSWFSEHGVNGGVRELWFCADCGAGMFVYRLPYKGDPPTGDVACAHCLGQPVHGHNELHNIVLPAPLAERFRAKGLLSKWQDPQPAVVAPSNQNAEASVAVVIGPLSSVANDASPALEVAAASAEPSVPLKEGVAEGPSPSLDVVTNLEAQEEQTIEAVEPPADGTSDESVCQPTDEPQSSPRA